MGGIPTPAKPRRSRHLPPASRRESALRGETPGRGGGDGTRTSTTGTGFPLPAGGGHPSAAGGNRPFCEPRPATGKRPRRQPGPDRPITLPPPRRRRGGRAAPCPLQGEAGAGTRGHVTRNHHGARGRVRKASGKGGREEE